MLQKLKLSLHLKAVDLIFSLNMALNKLTKVFSKYNTKLQDQLRSKYKKYLMDLDLFEHPDINARGRGYLDLHGIRIKPEFQKEGIGSKIMQEIMDYADSNDLDVVLTPNPLAKKPSLSKLKGWYKKFGFVENKGRNKDFTFSRSMIRYANGIRPWDKV